MYKYVFRLKGTENELVSLVDNAPVGYEEIESTVGLLEFEHGGEVEWECVTHPNLNAVKKVDEEDDWREQVRIFRGEE